MNAIVPTSFGPVSARFAGTPTENELSAGVQQGFPILGYKGKTWSYRFRGNKIDMMRPDGDGPANSMELVILKSSAHVSKIWYENGYAEGSSSPPDCFSTNGVTPDAGSKKKQSATCALCPKNQWGARITPQGKPGKACSDSKRLAVLLLPDVAKGNERDGPILLRVPAASLSDLAAFGDTMQRMGYPYYSIGARIAFDAKESYPKFAFSAIRPLSDPEADFVLKLRDDPRVSRILAEGSEHAGEASAPEPTPQSVFEQPPVTPVVTQAAPAPQPQPAPAPAPQPAPAPMQAAPALAPTPAETTAAQSDFEAALDAQLNQLLPDVD